MTNAQYARFVAETGRRPPRYWEGPRPPVELTNHPVVDITWYDAVAYAEWVGARLPTEQEWEKAARGYGGREYPWSEWAEGWCNVMEAEIGKTSPVGHFSPGGDSSYGLQDMAGNVWEWTASELEEERYRVLRGGSFLSIQDWARCAFRNRLSPDQWGGDYGFRVVISTCGVSQPPFVPS